MFRGGTKMHTKNLTWRWVGVLSLLLVALFAGGAARAQRPEPPLRGHRREPAAHEPLVVEKADPEAGITATTLSLPAAADTYIASAHPAENFGGDALYLGYNYSATGDYFGAQRILIRFDLSVLPAGAVIHDADLRLYLYLSIPTDDDPMPSVIRRLDSSWDEYAVTWNSEPTWGPVYPTKYINDTISWYEWDVTELVTDWTSGAETNYGMEIIGDEQIQERERVFYSHAHASLDPRLVVEYTVTDDDEPPIVTVDALPPTSTVDPLPTLTNSTSFFVSWSGNDGGGSGIAHYDVWYRQGNGGWILWLENTTATSATFNAPEDAGYGFEVRAEDNLGRVETFHGEAETSIIVDAEAPFIEPRIWLPLIIRNAGASTVQRGGM